MNTEAFSDVEYQPLSEEAMVETDAAPAEFPCENKLGFTALCASCYLVRLLGDCPKNIRENATSAENPFSDNQEPLLFALEQPTFSFDSDLVVDESTFVAPAQEVISVQEVTLEAPRQEQPPAVETTPIAEPEKAPTRSYHDLLFDDAVEVVVATPRASQASVAPEPVPVHVLEQEDSTLPIYEAPVDGEKMTIAEIEIAPEPLVTKEPFIEPVSFVEEEPPIEAEVILGDAVLVISDETKPEEEISPLSLFKTPSPLPAIDTVLAVAQASTPEPIVISKPIATEPEMEIIDEITGLAEPEIPLLEEVLDISEENFIEVVAEDASLEELEIKPQDLEIIIEQQEANSVENDYANTVCLSDNYTELSAHLSDQDLATPNTPERLLPTIQKYSGASFRYARSFIGAFALLTLVLVDR